MEMGSFSWQACSITACRCSRGACPTLFLAAHSPRPVVHKSAPVRQFLLLLMGHQKSMKAERPLLHADHTRFSSVKPHWKPGYAHGKSELGAFLHLPADELWSASILCCELFRSSFFSFGILFSQFTTFLTRCAVWSLGFTPNRALTVSPCWRNTSPKTRSSRTIPSLCPTSLQSARLSSSSVCTLAGSPSEMKSTRAIVKSEKAMPSM